MPFKSESQRRYLWANEPAIARRWTNEGKKMPPGKRPSPPANISAVERKMKRDALAAKGEVAEDDPGFNTQTMGNRRHGTGKNAPAVGNLIKSGRYRMHAAPGTQKRPRTKQKMEFAAAVSRRLKNKDSIGAARKITRSKTKESD